MNTPIASLCLAACLTPAAALAGDYPLAPAYGGVLVEAPAPYEYGAPVLNVVPAGQAQVYVRERHAPPPVALVPTRIIERRVVQQPGFVSETTHVYETARPPHAASVSAVGPLDLLPPRDVPLAASYPPPPVVYAPQQPAWRQPVLSPRGAIY